MADRTGYDYVIVGAGSAGCVLAYRLTADPTVRVLLLEAGGRDTHPLIHVPIGLGKIWEHRMFDWGYDTSPSRGWMAAALRRCAARSSAGARRST